MADNAQGNNRGNQRRNNAADKSATVTTAPADTTTTDTTSTTSAPADTVALATPAVVPVQTQTVESPVEEALPSTLDANDEDTRQVAELKVMLTDLVKLVRGYGENPEDFADAAKKSLQVTRFVIQYPKLPVLNALLSFFEENVDGVCQPHTLLKGSTTLSKNDEKQVGFLFALFGDLARKQVIRVENSVAVSVLKKAEIINFYNRKVAKIVQDNKS